MIVLDVSSISGSDAIIPGLFSRWEIGYGHESARGVYSELISVRSAEKFTDSYHSQLLSKKVDTGVSYLLFGVKGYSGKKEHGGYAAISVEGRVVDYTEYSSPIGWLFMRPTISEEHKKIVLSSKMQFTSPTGRVFLKFSDAVLDFFMEDFQSESVVCVNYGYTEVWYGDVPYGAQNLTDAIRSAPGGN